MEHQNTIQLPERFAEFFVSEVLTLTDIHMLMQKAYVRPHYRETRAQAKANVQKI
jgi:hypothetical protein